MLRIGLALATGVACAAPAAAQDALDQYLDAERAFLPVGTSRDPADQRLGMAYILQGLEGTWIEGTVIFSEIDRTETEARAQMQDWVDRACAHTSVFTLTAPMPYEFEMTRATMRREQEFSFTMTYAYVGGNLFNRHTDQAEYADYLGLRDVETGELRPFAMQTMASVTPSLFGTVALYHPSEDVLVLQGVPGTTQIYLRCA